MTYIIAEPCIDIKDRSCVDVCPVDCIHEYERLLVIDPEECIDCFAPEERLITSRGVRSFAELENQACRVLTDRSYKSAVVKRFRRKPLVKIELAPAFEERDRYGGTRLTTRNRSRFRRVVRATPTHSWVLFDGERTDALAPGQFVPSMRALPKRDSESYRLGVVRSSANLKRLLPETSDREYITGFIDGWLAADGDPVKAGSWRLRSTDHEALAWLKQAAVVAGYVAVGSGEETNVETNFGVRSRPIRWLYLATREVSWRVMSVEAEEGDAAETFCAIVPGKNEFTLAGGIYTRNCGACEPECPVEAIFPEDALPEKWEPFVKINYAYPDADVINRLTDEYATEHNVQNPPLE